MARTIHVAAVLVALLSIAAGVAAQQKGKGREGFGNFGGGAGSTLAGLAANEAVQKDVGLKGDLTEKFASLRDDITAARLKEFQIAGISFQDVQSLASDERQKRRDKIAEIEVKLNEEFNPKMKALVSADQYKRLQQIQLQANLAMRGPGTLTYSDIANELNLTDEQKKKLDESQAELDAKQRELFSGGGGGGEAFAKLREERITKTMEVLNAEQKERLATLKGGAFDLTQLGVLFGGRKGKGN